MKRLHSLIFGICCLALVFSSIVPRTHAQSEKKPTATVTLSVQEQRGQGIFFQRCSLCHMTKMETPAPQPFKSFGPSLKGMVQKDADADQISFFRDFIMTGTDRMPGFRYGLKPSEIDDVIAYLKTL
jgi:mono/diheme cytochrome c family protein